MTNYITVQESNIYRFKVVDNYQVFNDKYKYAKIFLLDYFGNTQIVPGIVEAFVVKIYKQPSYCSYILYVTDIRYL